MLTRRERILHGAAEVVSRHGYHGASLRAIARHVGMSHPGMLHHFPTKQSLIDGIVEHLERQTRCLLQNVEHVGTHPEGFVQDLRNYWISHRFDLELLARLDAEAVDHQVPHRLSLARLRLVHEHVWTTAFVNLAHHGHLREGTDVDLAGRTLCGFLLASSLREHTVGEQQRDHDHDPLDDLRLLIDMYVHPSGGARSGP